ncbi:hypothetical protein NIES4073_58970 [Kalymmatonema gypsitolerans NIES-4073]|nr:hypothetical protein NIES4073_58970 [Scytonema sp. NIES-4073]
MDLCGFGTQIVRTYKASTFTQIKYDCYTQGYSQCVHALLIGIVFYVGIQ